MADTITLATIKSAAERVRGVAHHTPLLHSRSLSERVGAQVHLKAENLQRAGSFKIRGAVNRLATLTKDQLARGVVAASAGNHAQGIALAARLLGPSLGFPNGVPCTIVMPSGASMPKVQATRGYGAHVLLHGETYDQALAEALRLARERQHTFVHSFDDEAVIAGQGTVGLELVQDLPDVELAIVPIGGGGLAAGVAIALHELAPRCKVVGVQVESAPACATSLRAGRIVSVPPRATLADGIAIGQPGALTFPVIQRLVADVVTVSEEEAAHAILLLLERAKLLVEGAGAVGLAALLSGKVAAKGQRVAVLLSGGNIDATDIARTVQHGLVHADRYLSLRVTVPDRPGGLARLADAIAEAGGNVIDVEHHRYEAVTRVGEVQIETTVETRDAAHAAALVELLRQRGYVSRRTGVTDLKAPVDLVYQELPQAQ